VRRAVRLASQDAHLFTTTIRQSGALALLAWDRTAFGAYALAAALGGVVPVVTLIGLVIAVGG
jgi:hypothetical protein